MATKAGRLTQQQVEMVTLHVVAPVAGYPDRWSPRDRLGAVLVVEADRVELWAKGQLEQTWKT